LHAGNQRQDISGIIQDIFQVILKFNSRILFRANIAHCMSPRKSRIMSHLDIQALYIHHGVIEVIALSGDTDVTASSSGNTDAIKVI